MTTLEDTIRAAMPGVKWTEWQPKFIQGVAAKKTKAAARAISEFLGRLPVTVAKVSSKVIRQGIALAISEDVRIAAVKSVDAENLTWKRQGRSFIRATA